jgi:hypothetical protein
MKFNKTFLYVLFGWVASVGVAYASGWWSGVKSVTSVAASAAHTGFSLFGIGLLVSIGVASVIAFMARGYLDRKVT